SVHTLFDCEGRAGAVLRNRRECERCPRCSANAVRGRSGRTADSVHTLFACEVRHLPGLRSEGYPPPSSPKALPRSSAVAPWTSSTSSLSFSWRSLRSSEACASCVCSSTSSVERVAFCCPPPVSLVAITLTPLSSPDMVGMTPIGDDQTLQAWSDNAPVLAPT